MVSCHVISLDIHPYEIQVHLRTRNNSLNAIKTSNARLSCCTSQTDFFRALAQHPFYVKAQLYAVLLATSFLGISNFHIITQQWCCRVHKICISKTIGQ